MWPGRVKLMTRLQLFLASLSLSGFAAFVTPALAQGPAEQPPAEEPGRAVARVSLMNGDASVRRGDSGEWVAATVNAPLLAEDSIHVAPGGYAEVQFDHSNYLRVAGDSEARISTLDNGRFGVQVIKGLVTFRVLRQNAAMAEVATPQVAVRPGPGGAVRVELLAEGYSRISVRAGEADVFTPKGVEKIRPGSMMMVRGTAQDPEFQMTAAAVPDEWDQFNEKRDRDLLAAKSYQYVSPEVSGAEDLDNYGHWATDAQYGSVWVPTVGADWAPYRSGRWVWEDFYGWVWVAYEPWGWAPYHYGSWYYRTGLGWAWYPGPVNRHHYWRPALVAFFGHGGFSVGIGYGGIGWVPLAPFEIYRPWYGRGWYGGRTTIVNNVTVVNNTNITNVYRNARVTGAVSGVTAQDFTGGRFGTIRPVGAQQLQSASLMRGAVPVQPTAANLRFADRTTTTFGTRAAANQNFASRMSAQSTRTPFAQQQAAFNGVSRAAAAPVSRPMAGTTSAGTANHGGWQRFGSTPATTQRMSQPTAGTRPATSYSGTTSQSAGWQRFGQPSGGATGQSVQPQRQYSAPAAPQQRYSAPQSSGRAVQVAPPMVQQRSAPAPAPSRSSSAPARSSGGSRSAGQSHPKR